MSPLRRRRPPAGMSLRRGTLDYAVVIPTIGRPSLRATLRSLAEDDTGSLDAVPSQVVVVDDRPLSRTDPLRPEELLPRAPWPLRVIRTGGRGPAAARNAGWRSVVEEWVVFLDDDVVVPRGWSAALEADLRDARPRVAGVQARLHVPLPTDRHPTDWERSTHGLEGARWATADMAYRRVALAGVHGFDERFPRAYREDADLALRVRRAGWDLVQGRRTTLHPVRPADGAVSVRVQRGAADDALMRALHGRRWRRVAETGRGRFRWHVLTVGSLLYGLLGALRRRPSRAAAGAAGWLALTADFARRRIEPGPRRGEPGWEREWVRMAWTSLVIPFAAVRHRLRGTLRHRGGAPAWPPPVRAVLFDRDGTLVHDVPYNGDPDRVRPVADARSVLDAVRAAGLKVGVVTNQSGIGRGLLTPAQVAAVNARVAAELGPFDTWQQCPHREDEGCSCRKPGPGMVLRAAGELGVAPYECAVVGDIGADVGAAVAAGARAVLVPTATTRSAEIAVAPVTATDLRSAVETLGVPVPDAGVRG